jgi:hypothetical protein
MCFQHIMTMRRLLLSVALAGAALLSGCAVYPVGAPVVYGDPGVAYGAAPVAYGAAPVVVAPAPVYYGPAVYPSISISGRYYDGPRWRGRGWR